MFAGLVEPDNGLWRKKYSDWLCFDGQSKMCEESRIYLDKKGSVGSVTRSAADATAGQHSTPDCPPEGEPPASTTATTRSGRQNACVVSPHRDTVVMSETT